jgi:hypothetical protein
VLLNKVLSAPPSHDVVHRPPLTVYLRARVWRVLGATAPELQAIVATSQYPKRRRLSPSPFNVTYVAIRAPLNAAQPRKRASCNPWSQAAGFADSCWRSFT